MQPSRYLGPFPAPHKTVQFWSFVALLTLALLCAPFVLPVFVSLPAISFRGWLSSAGITMVIVVPVVWLGFRFGRIGWFLVGVGFLVLGLTLRYRS